MVGMVVDGVEDRVVGALLACVVAADLAHTKGQDQAFATWFAACCREEDADDYPEQSFLPAQPTGHPVAPLVEAILDFRHDRTSAPGNGDARDIGQAIWNPGADASDPLPALTTIAGLPAPQIVALVARAGASMIPADWWSFGSLGDPSARGWLIRASAHWAIETSGNYFAQDTGSKRLRAGPVRHPHVGVWFGNPSHVLAVPHQVGAVVSLGRVPRGFIPGDVDIEFPLPWLADCFDSPAATWEWGAQDETDDGMIEGVLLSCPPMITRGPEPYRGTALASAIAMIDALPGLCGEVLVLGDQSGGHLNEIWSGLTRLHAPQSRDSAESGAHAALDGLYETKLRGDTWFFPRPERGVMQPPRKVATAEGAAFLGVSVGSEATWADRVAALRRGTPPATMRDLTDAQRSFTTARDARDPAAAERAQARFSQLLKIVLDVELLSAMDVMSLVDEAARIDAI